MGSSASGSCISSRDSICPVHLEERSTIPTEIWDRIIRAGLENVKSVNVLSRVCRMWREIVYGTSWTFHAYLPISLITTFPNLPEPEVAFFLVRESEDVYEKVLEWMQRKKVRRVRLHIQDPHFTKASSLIQIFRFLLNEDLEELLVRLSGTKAHDKRRLRGLWYQKRAGKLVVDMRCPQNLEDVRALIEDLSPEYLVLGGFPDSSGEMILRQEPFLPPCVRVLGVGEISVIHLLDLQWVREIRILHSESLDPYQDERYGVMDVLAMNYGIFRDVFPSVRTLIGGVREESLEAVTRIFPCLSNVHVKYPDPQNEGDDFYDDEPDWREGADCHPDLIPLHPGTRVFRYHTDVHHFWAYITPALFDRITAFLSLTDLLALTQVFRLRGMIRTIRGSISAGLLLRSFPTQQLKNLRCLGTMTVESLVLSSLGNLLNGTIGKLTHVHIQRDETSTNSTISRVLETISTQPLRVSGVTITFEEDPRALITIEQKSYAIMDLPVSYRPWYQLFQDTKGSSTIIECSFY